MRGVLTVALLSFGVLAGAGPARACPWLERLELNDVSHADVVVVGRVGNYTMVLDPEARRRRQELLARTSGKFREILETQSTFLSDYARFDIVVEEVLRGTASDRLTVTWDNSTFGEPRNMPPGPFLIALRNADSPQPPMRGPTATILPTPEPAYLTVLQAPCAPEFIFESTSDQAESIREILKSGAIQAP
ncbi:hypothetical protein AMC82_CH02640 [Rhizobium phaseoli]|uniref:Uncharacterized protein n=2 Tax=Rhizobium/Agrobacterium group TaxID=227290 RepID=A0A192TCQ6_9HYPH|nr:hypothetical protein AMC88_CH02704 [Rhizobium phaseoli]ANL53814.1 hypothetical protein AMC86_CH02689 [Rhizobium phaseoli]ANL60067.1 hypothetical protein AMC85_CH02703 [Rhizobium phaseoli]ANL66274.1 hypothetical protein AMC84_CH02650 [Rhizobium phaseoli]ANL79088.1 hypothetical protein AMC82_CH02640 [Rhizobium phaseoli]